MVLHSTNKLILLIQQLSLQPISHIRKLSRSDKSAVILMYMSIRDKSLGVLLLFYVK